MTCVWFNQPYLSNIFKPGQEVVLYGKVDIFKKRLQMVVPDFEIIATEDRSLNMGRIVPVYPAMRAAIEWFRTNGYVAETGSQAKA